MSDVQIGRYTFFSWYRRGIAGLLSDPDPLTGGWPTLRAQLHAEANIQASLAGSAVSVLTGTVDAEVYGPGDVIGLDPRHVVKTEPRNLTANFEPNYFAAIDFDEPTLPWLLTPAAPAGDRLRPWCCLLVLTPKEFTRSKGISSTLPIISVSAESALPDLSESWAWAHVQVSGEIPQAGLAELVRTNPAAVISRIVCPRRLEADTAYSAFLVPTFDVGVEAGKTGKPGAAAAIAPAWPGAAGKPLDLPVLYEFEFHTSAQGDFESLVRQLQPRVMPSTVGVRPVQVDQPGWGLPPAGPPLLLGGALTAPVDRADDWREPERGAFGAAAATLISRADPSAYDANAPGDDPTIAPPIYGRWHAHTSRIDPSDTGWVRELNLDPRNRIAAGLGTQVVLANRIALMASAWQQVDGIRKANELLRQAQLAREALGQVMRKHIASLEPAAAFSLTSAVQGRIFGSPTTIRAHVAASRLPRLALSGAFRRVSRPRGPMRRRHGRITRTRPLLARMATGEITASPPLHPPAGMVSLDQVSTGISARRLPSWLRRLMQLPPVLVFVLLLVLIVILATAFSPGAALLAVIVVAFAASRLRQVAAGSALGPNIESSAFTAEHLRALAPSPTFRLQNAPQPGSAATTADDVSRGHEDAADFKRSAGAVAAFATAFTPDPPARPELDLPKLRDKIISRLDPERTVPERVAATIKIGQTRLISAKVDPLDEIMAAPEFPQPMYAPLRDLSKEYLLPGLEQIPAETITVVETERAFLESYMTGLNHEMARQLLWHEYPTDQRGSYFRQFWDVSGYVRPPSVTLDDATLVEALKDIPPIHRWDKNNDLGRNPNTPPEPLAADGCVLLIRGELLRRYPTATIMAAPARWKDGSREPTDEVIYPLFRGTMDPDITFFGFNVSRANARGSDLIGDDRPGWFFIIQQQVSEPRFGLEPANWTNGAAPTVTQWNDLSWANFADDAVALRQLGFAPTTQPTQLALAEQTVDGVVINPGDPSMRWGVDAAQTAFITLRRPVRIAVHASLMLGQASQSGT